MTPETLLLDWFRLLPGVAIAFSGGVDSSLVAAAAQRVLENRAVAFTSDSPSVPRAELQAATELAASLGLRHVVLKTDEFNNPDYTRNSGDRCYFCKSTLYDTIATVLPQYDLHIVCSGANLDDLGDYRPGLSAAAERGIRHPLQECGFTKAMVRDLARHWNLPVAEKPASPCLSSRLAPGLAVTPERTLRVELAEAFLKSLGFSDGRVRYHEGDLARVELPVEELDRALTIDCRNAITAKLHELGFKFVTIDLDGFRSGSLNQLVTLELRSRFGQPLPIHQQ
jgi:pyridinium-3,5-biscarboxylic acid mononucleotide sulfurtransferase